MIRISFIVPTYNNGGLISRCIKSIEGQFASSNDDYEIIIINDGSTDNTGSVIKELAAKNLSVIILEKKNGGVSSARNDGIKASKGKYIYFVDADDFLYPNTIPLQLDIMDRLNLDTLKVGSNSLPSSYIVDLKALPSHDPQAIDEILKTTSVKSGKDWLISDRDSTRSPWNYIHRSEIIKANDVKFPPNVAISEDLLFNISAIAFSKRIACSPITTYGYIVYKHSACHRRRNFEESFSIGMANVSANIGLAEWLGSRGVDKQILYNLERIRDYNAFAYCLWPMVRDSISVKKAKGLLMRLSEIGAYPIGKPVDGFVNMKHSTPLNTLWLASRYKGLFLAIVFIKNACKRVKSAL